MLQSCATDTAACRDRPTLSFGMQTVAAKGTDLMQQLWPDPGENPDDLAAELSVRPAWVGLNFVTALDGAVVVDGTSGPLGGDGDRQLFLALRDRCDVVLVGAGTVRAENYGPTSDRAARARQERGQTARPALAIVTRSGDLLGQNRLWEDRDMAIVVVTGPDIPPGVMAELEHRGAEVVVTGDDGVDLAIAMQALAARGWHRAMCEGGPELAHDLVAAGLVTDMFTTIAGTVVGGGSSMVPTVLDEPVELSLMAVRRANDELLLHHRVIGTRIGEQAQ